VTLFSVTYGWNWITGVAPQTQSPTRASGPLVAFLERNVFGSLHLRRSHDADSLQFIERHRLLGKYHTLGQHSRKNYCDDISASRRTSHAFTQSTFLSQRPQLSDVQSRTPPDLKLRLIHIHGAFVLLFVGTTIADIAIVAELAYVRYETFNSIYLQVRWQNCEKRQLASSCVSVQPSVRMEHLGSQRTDFHEI